MALLTTTGCAPIGQNDDGVPSPQTSFERLQVAVAHELGELVDSSGLIANPFDTETLPLDLYGTAMLLRAQETLGMDGIKVIVDELSQADIDAYQMKIGAPDAWLAFAISTLGASPAIFSITPSVSQMDGIGDVNEQATMLWLSSIYAPSHSRIFHTDIIKSLVNDTDLDNVALERVLESCERLKIACPKRVSKIVGSGKIDTVEQMISTRATLNLVRRGVPVSGVNGVDLVELADSAEQTIASATGGYEVEVSTLAEIAFVADGRRGAFEQYLQRSASRLDIRTGVFRTYAEPRGTIANTFNATLAVGPYWRSFLTQKKILRSVELDLTRRRPGVSPVDDLHALYLKSLFKQLSAEDDARLDQVVMSCKDDLKATSQRVMLAQLLPLVGRTACRPRIEIQNIESAPEEQRIDLISAAQDGVLANSDELLSHFTEYLGDLPKRALDGQVDDPLFLDRLGLLANVPDSIELEQWRDASTLIAQRTGCPETPHLIRVSSAPTSTCDVGLTRMAMSFGVDYAEDRND